MKIKVKDVFSIPNILSYIRLILIPIFVATYINADSIDDYHLASLIVVVSGLTDLFDGYIARRFNQITEIGKVLDPIADKLTQAAIIICLMFKIKYMYLLVIIFVFKELFMGVCSLILLRNNKKLNGAMWFGKVSTAVFYVVMVVIVAIPSLNHVAVNILMLITGSFLVFSMIRYTHVFIQMFKEVKL